MKVFKSQIHTALICHCWAALSSEESHEKVTNSDEYELCFRFLQLPVECKPSGFVWITSIYTNNIVHVFKRNEWSQKKNRTNKEDTCQCGDKHMNRQKAHFLESKTCLYKIIWSLLLGLVSNYGAYYLKNLTPLKLNHFSGPFWFWHNYDFRIKSMWSIRNQT